MDTITFSCNIVNESKFNDLALEFWLNDNKFFDSKIAPGITQVGHGWHVQDDNTTDYTLKIVLKDKEHKHTTIDDTTGEILEDSLLEIKDIAIDDMNIDYIFYTNSKYTHNFNDSGDLITDQFYGTLGCNGEVVFNFSTPFYLWLLEHI